MSFPSSSILEDCRQLSYFQHQQTNSHFQYHHQGGILNSSSSSSSSSNLINHVKLSDLNEFISCPVCGNYLIDATTVSECLHTFCKSCIIKHIKEDRNDCPKCNTIIHERRPLDYIVHDRNKQDIVYKLVPHLYIKELKKRIANKDPEIDEVTKFLIKKNSLSIILVFKESNDYINNNTSTSNIIKLTTHDASTTMTTISNLDNNHHSSLSQQQLLPQQPQLLLSDPVDPNLPPTVLQQQQLEQNHHQDVQPKTNPIFLRCPFTIRVRCLRKLLIMKYQLGPNDKVTILYKGDIICDDDLVSNLAQSLTFRFQYQISRLSVKDSEAIEIYRQDPNTVGDINNKRIIKNRSCQLRRNKPSRQSIKRRHEDTSTDETEENQSSTEEEIESIGQNHDLEDTDEQEGNNHVSNLIIDEDTEEDGQTSIGAMEEESVERSTSLSPPQLVISSTSPPHEPLNNASSAHTLEVEEQKQKELQHHSQQENIIV